MKDVYVLDFKKASPTETTDGALTAFGIKIANQYASAWLRSSSRDLNLERLYPELSGLFYDIRIDPPLARSHATSSSS